MVQLLAACSGVTQIDFVSSSVVRTAASGLSLRAVFLEPCRAGRVAFWDFKKSSRTLSFGTSFNRHVIEEAWSPSRKQGERRHEENRTQSWSSGHGDHC